MNKAGKWIAFIGIIAACFTVAYERFKTEWERFKLDFPDEPEGVEVASLDDEPIRGLSVPQGAISMQEQIDEFEKNEDLPEDADN